MLKANHSKRNRLIGFVVSLLILIASAWVILNRDYIKDLTTFWSYTPSSQIESISSRAGLSDKGKFYLYASLAEVQDSEDFNRNCQRQEDKNAILGCYVGNRIYIYDVDNSELDGIKEVTAAHEMLHAAWQRTSEPEKQRVGKLLIEAYNANKTDELAARMDYYSRNEVGEEINELHSIIGTEIRTLSSELEKYYAKFFVNRGQVVALYDKYHRVFSELETKAKVLYDELTQLEKDYLSMESSYDAKVSKLNQDIVDFNKRADSGDFDSVAAFNYERSKLAKRISDIKLEEQAIEKKYSQYELKYDEYQALAVKSETLNKSIDSTVAPVPSL